METTKRLYSINLGAFLIATTDLIPTIEEDEGTHTYYMRFPECNGVRQAIKLYKTGNPTIELHSFLRAIKLIRETMAAKKVNEDV